MKKNLIRNTLVAATLGLIVTGVACAEGHSDKAKEIEIVASAKVSLSQAIAAAEKDTGGKAIKAEMDDESKEAKYEIHVIKDGKVQEIMVDTQTGGVSAEVHDKDHEDTEEDDVDDKQPAK